MSSKDSPRQDLSGMAMAQGDLAVNLFIVLLVVLSVLTVAQVSSNADGYLTPFRRSETAEALAAPSLGWQPVLPAYPKLVVRQGRVHLLDATALALAFAEGAPLVLPDGAVDNSKLLEGHLDPASFQLFVWLHDGGVPAPLSAASVPLNALEDDAFWAALGEVPKLDIFAYPDQLAQLTPLLDAVHGRKIAARVVALSNDAIFGYAYSGRDFGLERSFK